MSSNFNINSLYIRAELRYFFDVIRSVFVIERAAVISLLQRDSRPKKGEKEGSTVRSPLGRIGLWCLFSTEVLWGVGVWLGTDRADP